jgi:hypothetical protein
MHGMVSIGRYRWRVCTTSRRSLEQSTSNSQSTTAQASELRGQSVTVLGQNVVSIGTQFEAQGGELHIEGADKTLLYAAQDSHRSESHTTTQRSTFGVTTGRSDTSSRAQSTSAVRTELISDQAVRIGVGERAELLGASVSAPQINFVRSQNAAPNAAGQLHLGAAIEQDSASTHTSSTTLGLWQKQQGSGHERSSGQMTELSGSVSIDPSIRLSIELPREVNSNSPTSAPSLQAQIQQLASQNPGLAYLSQLQDNPAVKWSELELAQREWDYSQQGLTGAGAALVSLAVAWATGGMGAGLVGTTTATATGTVTTLGGTTLATTTAATATAAATATTFAAGAAINAGFSALAAQASVSLVNNSGDIGRTLKDLGSTDSLQTLVASMATAGALSSLGSHMHIGGKPLGSITVNDGFTANLGKAVVNNLTSATLNSALTGASLEDSIQTALVSAATSAGAGQVANSIGDLTPNNPTLKALAHALAGCVSGSAGQGGSAGCTAGAAGAVVGELAAQWYNPEGDLSLTAETLAFASLMAGVAGALATGDGDAASVNTAATTGANAALNNYLNHTKPSLLALSEKEAYERAAAECGPSNPSACQRANELRDLSRARDQQLQQACAAGPTQQCATLTNQATDMGNHVHRDGHFVWANSPDKGFGLNVSTAGNARPNPALTNNWQHQQSGSLSQGILLGTLAATPGAAYTTGARAAAGAQAGTQATINALRAEAQLLQFGYYRYAVPAIPGALNIANNPQHVQNAADFVLSVTGVPTRTAPLSPGALVGTEIYSPGQTIKELSR